ncbi:hypothetical protein, partial [Streptococcus suis]|uniref:hypothetical protein n=1 Tax=Streptococcus suis TaxID=1307 RepID=UPI002FCA9315
HVHLLSILSWGILVYQTNMSFLLHFILQHGKPMKQILDDFIDKVFNNSIVKGLKKKISQLTGELKRARVQLQHERSVRIAEQKEAEKKMDSLLKEVQPAMNLYEDFQNYLTENDKKKVFERIEKHKKLHQKQISKNRNTNDYER